MLLGYNKLITSIERGPLTFIDGSTQHGTNDVNVGTLALRDHRPVSKGEATAVDERAAQPARPSALGTTQQRACT